MTKLAFFKNTQGIYSVLGATGDHRYGITETPTGWQLRIGTGGVSRDGRAIRVNKYGTFEEAVEAAERFEASAVRFCTYAELSSDEQRLVMDNWGGNIAEIHEYLYRPLGDGVKIAERVRVTHDQLVKCDNGMGWTKKSWLAANAPERAVEEKNPQAELYAGITERHMIADALNFQAQHYDALTQDRRASDASKDVWKQAAQVRRDLARKIVGGVEIKPIPFVGVDYGRIETRVLAADPKQDRKVGMSAALGAHYGGKLANAIVQGGASAQAESINGVTVFQDVARPARAGATTVLYRVGFEGEDGFDSPTFTTWETDGEASADYAANHGGRLFKGYFAPATADRILAENARKAEQSKTVLAPKITVEEQADGSWAVFRGGGFVRNFKTKQTADQFADAERRA